jgi:S1-C subfamily serine protease
MDMEKLTKQQIVLVTLLVSFVTSIATGIVTVALMDQAPPGVTQTINRVVERTVEKVVTPPSTGNAAAVITRETVVVKEDDKIVESVDKNKVSVARIYTDTRREGERVFVGLGTIVTKEGLVATGEVFGDTRAKYVITTNGIDFYPVVVLPKKDETNLYFLKVVQDEKNPITFVPVVFSDSNSLKLGQTIIAWGGDTRNSVSTGIISSLIDTETAVASGSTSTAPTRNIIGLMTNNNLSDSIAGGPLLNLYGETIGIRVSANISDQFIFLPVNILKQEIIGL